MGLVHNGTGMFSDGPIEETYSRHISKSLKRVVYGSCVAS